MLFDVIQMNGAWYESLEATEIFKQFLDGLGEEESFPSACVSSLPDTLHSFTKSSPVFLFFCFEIPVTKKVRKTTVLDNPQEILFTLQWLRKDWNLKPVGN